MPRRLDSAQIEAAAMALRDAVANRSQRVRPWSALPDSLKQQYRQEAQAAVSAYLEDA